MAYDESVYSMYISERMECPKGAGLMFTCVDRKSIGETQGCRMRTLHMKMMVK